MLTEIKKEQTENESDEKPYIWFSMGIDLSNPYIHRTTVLCDKHASSDMVSFSQSSLHLYLCNKKHLDGHVKVNTDSLKHIRMIYPGPISGHSTCMYLLRSHHYISLSNQVLLYCIIFPEV